MTREAQAVVQELKEEGLSDEEIVWYAVNMHDAEEYDVRTELQALRTATQEPVAEKSAIQEGRDPSSETSNFARENAEPVAMDPRGTNRTDRLDSENDLDFEGWLNEMRHLKGGWLGLLVILVTISAAPFLIYYGVGLFPAGRYPRLVLVLPGLVGTAVVFFCMSLALWPLKKRSSSSQIREPARSATKSPATEPRGTARTARHDASDVANTQSPPTACGVLSGNGYWIALKVFVLSAVVSSVTTKLFIVPDLPYRMEEQMGSMLYYFAFAGLIVWTLMRQVEISVPGSRWAGVSRPVIYGISVIAGHYTVSAVMWPEWMPGPSYIIEMMFASLFFFEILTLLRRWLVLIGIPFFIALHIVIIEGFWWTALGFADALSSPGAFLDTFTEVTPYILQDEVPVAEKVAFALQSAAEVMVCWALFAFCGKYSPGKSLSEFGASVLRMPTRLLRGEFGLARSFWYFGVLGWLPIRIFNLYALHVESQAMLVAFSVLNAGFWILVGYVLWRAAKGYSGPRTWPFLAGLTVVLGIFASAGAVAGLEG